MNIQQKVALRFIERAEKLGYRGKRRDDAALDFFTGAHSALATQEFGGMTGLETAILAVSVRGALAVHEMANGLAPA